MLSCKEYVASQKSILKQKIDSLKMIPKLVVIQVDDNKASDTYIKGKKKDCEEVGIKLLHCKVESEIISQEELETMIKYYDNFKCVNGIIIQLPIPDKYDIRKLQKCISPDKDVDGFRKDSSFSPCTPKGIINYLQANEISLRGKDCVVIGRSDIVGKPLANMLIEHGATVTSCNSKTRAISKFTKDADIVISAIGKANYFDISYFKYSQIIVDVGINVDEQGNLCGDIDKDVSKKAKLLTPVPGGVGLLTRLALLTNVVEAYEIHQNERDIHGNEI